jgi:SAM-dependent methyltransferase
VSFDLNDLANHFDASALAKKDARANLYGVAGITDAMALYEKVVDELLRVLKPAPDAKILDIGCGTGEILERVALTCPDICGLDLAPAMAKIVSDKGYSAFAYDGGSLPFEDSRFDVVLIYQVFVNLPDAGVARRLLREAARVTRQGGEILVGAVPHPRLSGFPTHRLAWWKNTKMLLRRLVTGEQVIPYYSYDYAFFGDVLDALKLERLSFIPCRIPRIGWETKYHVILAK